MDFMRGYYGSGLRRLSKTGGSQVARMIHLETRGKPNRCPVSVVRYPTQDYQPAGSATRESYEQRDNYESASLPGQEVHATRPRQPLRTEIQTLRARSPATAPAYVVFSRHPPLPPSATMPEHPGTKPNMPRNCAERHCHSAHELAYIPIAMTLVRGPIAPSKGHGAVRPCPRSGC